MVLKYLWDNYARNTALKYITGREMIERGTPQNEISTHQGRAEDRDHRREGQRSHYQGKERDWSNDS